MNGVLCTSMPLEAIPRSVEIYQKEDGVSPYIEWLESLRDSRTVNRINQRIRRVEFGDLGDFKSLADEISELRLFFGKGYRVYFAEHGSSLVVLLIGGDKGSQKRDIEMAKEY